MNHTFTRTSLSVLCFAVVSFGATTLFDFENVAVGAIPAGWKVELMNKTSPLATFACAVNAAVPGAQAGNHVMKVTGYASGGVYADCHICWTDAVSFQDGTIEADCMATGGIAAENYAGLAWRIQDKNNYYALRYSPSEGMAVFKIVNGTRTTLPKVSSGTLTFAADKWYHFKLVQTGNSITITVDNTLVVTVTNSDIPAAGGVGLFMRSNTTKAEWDNLSVTTPGLSSVQPYSGRVAQSIMTVGKTTRAVNLQGRTINTFDAVEKQSANTIYYRMDQNSNNAVPVLKIKK